MNSIDRFQMAFRNLFRRKLRTFLTILGVVIGTGAIVLMLSLGIGMNEAVKQSIMEMGSINIISVYSGSGGYAGRGMMVVGGSSGSEGKLTDKAVQSFSAIPGVEAVTPYMSEYWKICTKKYAVEVEVVGLDPATMEKMNFDVAEGRLLNAADKNALVFGSDVMYDFHDRKSSGRRYGYRQQEELDIDLLQEKLELTFDMSFGQQNPFETEGEKKTPPKPYDVKAVGILAEGNWEQAWCVYMPIEQMKAIKKDQDKWEKEEYGSSRYNRSRNTNEYEQVKVKVADINDVEQVQKAITDMGYQAHSLNDILESSKKQMAVTQAVLGGIGAVSLLIAAIGIANTMVMSIYERTREIGIMKVIGATLRDIRRMFLLEAALIGLGGGMLGVGLSYLGSWIINTIYVQYGAGMMGPGDMTHISIVPWWLALAAMGFTSIIGLIAGYFPAVRATKLSALEAIQTV